MKKIIIIFVVLVTFFLITYNKLNLYINWKIYLPGIQRRIVIFDNFFRDGDQISIFKYYNKIKMKAIKDINHFNSISSENIDDIEEKLLDFYNGLSMDTKGIDGKEVYDKNINNEQLLNTDNYYLIKQEDKTYIILILDMKNKRLYTFITVR